MKAAWIAGLLVGASTLALPVAGFAQGVGAAVVEGSSADARMKAAEVVVRAKIVEFDAKSRVAALRDPRGTILLVDIPPDVKGLDQVRVGDDLVFRYVAAVVAQLEKVSGAGGIRERVETTEQFKSAPGALPGTAGRRTVDILAKVTAVNAKAGTVTLRGATRTSTVKVPPDVNIKALKVGDDVRATIVEAAVLDVERPPAK